MSRLREEVVATSSPKTVQKEGQTNEQDLRIADTSPATNKESEEKKKLSLVKEAQLELKKRDYKVGAIDGVLGPGTRAAVRSFQKDNNLTVNGRLDKNTIRKLRGTVTASVGNQANQKVEQNTPFSEPTKNKKWQKTSTATSAVEKGVFSGLIVVFVIFGFGAFIYLLVGKKKQPSGEANIQPAKKQDELHEIVQDC